MKLNEPGPQALRAAVIRLLTRRACLVLRPARIMRQSAHTPPTASTIDTLRPWEGASQATMTPTTARTLAAQANHNSVVSDPAMGSSFESYRRQSACANRGFGTPGNMRVAPRVRIYVDAGVADHERYARFFHRMLGLGIYLPPSGYELWSLSTEHRNPEIERRLEAAAETARVI